MPQKWQPLPVVTRVILVLIFTFNSVMGCSPAFNTEWKLKWIITVLNAAWLHKLCGQFSETFMQIKLWHKYGNPK